MDEEWTHLIVFEGSSDKRGNIPIHLDRPITFDDLRKIEGEIALANGLRYCIITNVINLPIPL